MSRIAVGRGRRLLAAVGAAAALAGGLAVPLGSGSAGAGVVSSTSGAGRASSAPRPLIGGARCRANRAVGTITFVSPFGYDASAGILDVIEAQRLGYFAELCLDVQIVTSSSTPYELVSSGHATVTGEGSAADLLEAVAAGSNLVGVATYGDTSDYALLTVPSITNLRQLVGKTLAYHPEMPVALTEMLQAAGVPIAKVRLVVDPSYNPLLLTEGRFDALQAYQSNEPITLRAAHQAFREYLPASYGVKGTFNVQVMNATFVHDHPGPAADFLRAELHAFDYCAAHATTCIAGEASAAGAAGVDYDRAHNLAEWRFEVGLAEQHRLPGAGVGVQSLAEWRPEASALVSHHLVSHLPRLASVDDTALAASLYSGTTLRWPGS